MLKLVVVDCESSRPTSRQMTIVFFRKLIFTLFYLNYIIIVGLLINIRRNPTSLPHDACPPTNGPPALIFCPTNGPSYFPAAISSKSGQLGLSGL